jgi:hypothetical protein
MAKTHDNSLVPEKRDEAETVGSNEPDNSDSEGGIFSGINEGALLRKLDLHLLPAVGVLYLLSFLDRSNGTVSSPLDTSPRAEGKECWTDRCGCLVGNARIEGLATDLHMSR